MVFGPVGRSSRVARGVGRLAFRKVLLMPLPGWRRRLAAAAAGLHRSVPLTGLQVEFGAWNVCMQSKATAVVQAQERYLLDQFPMGMPTLCRGGSSSVPPFWGEVMRVPCSPPARVAPARRPGPRQVPGPLLGGLHAVVPERRVPRRLRLGHRRPVGRPGDVRAVRMRALMQDVSSRELTCCARPEHSLLTTATSQQADRACLLWFVRHTRPKHLKTGVCWAPAALPQVQQVPVEALQTFTPGLYSRFSHALSCPGRAATARSR